MEGIIIPHRAERKTIKRIDITIFADKPEDPEKLEILLSGAKTNGFLIITPYLSLSEAVAVTVCPLKGT